MIIKYVIPIALKLMDDLKPDYKQCVIKLLQVLHNCMGNALDEQMPQPKLVKFYDLIK